MDNSATWSEIISSVPVADTQYLWEILVEAVSAECRVRVSDVNNAEVFDISDEVFAISQVPEPQLELISPNGGEDWMIGSENKISWTSNDIDTIKIEFSLDNGVTWNMIERYYPAGNAEYLWEIQGEETSSDCLVKITEVDENIVYDISDEVFTISPDTDVPDEINTFGLSNYPEPFSESTNICFNLETAQNVELTIYNSYGIVINKLADSYYTNGEHHVVFDGSSLPSGIYIYRIVVGKTIVSNKMVLLK